jgi:hypothetical protein
MYWVYMERRMQLKDKKDEAELMTFNLNYERWHQLYFPIRMPDIDMSTYQGGGGTLVEDEIEIPVTSIDELDAFYETRESTKWMGSSEIEPQSGGRRV